LEVFRTVAFNPNYSLAFNVLLLFGVFFGLFIKPLKDRLERGGTVVAVALALMLSVALAVSGRFELLRFEPVAAVVLFGLFGCAIAVAARRFYECSFPTTAAVAFLSGYSALSVVSPALLAEARDMLLIADLLVVLSLVWLVYALAARVFPSGPDGSSWMAHAERTLAVRKPDARCRLFETKQVQETLAEVARQETQGHAEVAAELDETAKTIRSYAGDETSLKRIVGARLEELERAQRQVEETFTRYKVLVERLVSLDAEEYSDLSRTLSQLPVETQLEAREELAGLRKRLGTDNVMSGLGQKINANNLAVREALRRARDALNAGQTQACLQGVREAKACEAEALRLAAQTRRFMEQLTQHVSRTVEKAAAKDLVEANR
jgi:hypothetical protein